jgi:hypothetical protein
MKGIILKIFILISTIALARFSQPVCKHAEFQKKIQVKRLKLGGDQTRFLASTPWESIRIYVDYTKLESQISEEVNEIRINYLKNVIDHTVDALQKLIKVKRNTTPLIITQCYKLEGNSIGSDVRIEGKDADLIIFP